MLEFDVRGLFDDIDHALLLRVLDARFPQRALTMHPDKAKVIYCKDGSRKGRYPNTQVDFLAYTFRARTVKNSKKNSLFVSFTAAVSMSSAREYMDEQRMHSLVNEGCNTARAISAEPGVRGEG